MFINKLFKDKYPSKQDWLNLKEDVQKYGLRNKYMCAIAPNASTSYIQNSTSSIMPIIDTVEIRQQGRLGRVYYPAPNITKDNEYLYESAYDLDQKAIIDVYVRAQKWTDQGISLNLYFYNDATTRDLNRIQVYAFKQGIKTLYYTRLKKKDLTSQNINNEECESCAV